MTAIYNCNNANIVKQDPNTFLGKAIGDYVSARTVWGVILRTRRARATIGQSLGTQKQKKLGTHKSKRNWEHKSKRNWENTKAHKNSMHLHWLSLWEHKSTTEEHLDISLVLTPNPKNLPWSRKKWKKNLEPRNWEERTYWKWWKSTFWKISSILWLIDRASHSFFHIVVRSWCPFHLFNCVHNSIAQGNCIGRFSFSQFFKGISLMITPFCTLLLVFCPSGSFLSHKTDFLPGFLRLQYKKKHFWKKRYYLL